MQKNSPIKRKYFFVVYCHVFVYVVSAAEQVYALCGLLFIYVIHHHIPSVESGHAGGFYGLRLI